ncbi:CPC_1213 family protein [Clostridium aestuarii]|uniref:CPC_1213 family protein n=1 Tax=Clostridium aestuarii TaxID=338193 RepID=A0ABT4D0P0_9CLOT|nr:CPC_1213 family protein [Clostridium aestuarii]MCY6484804.1 CPC_1213 family protein [Clostridium aestuarii]
MSKNNLKNKMKNTKNNQKHDGRFKKNNIKHGQAESARSVFGSRGETEIDDLLDID